MNKQSIIHDLLIISNAIEQDDYVDAIQMLEEVIIEVKILSEIA